MKCCNKQIKINRQTSGEKLYWMQCELCGKKGKGKTQKDAENAFRESKPANATPQSNAYQLQPIPKNNLMQWSQANMPALMNQSAQFIDKPETRRMIESNIRYITNLKGKAWDKIWSTPEGQESISHALSEANYYAATLGKMGDLVPFGSTCEFIASVECFKFALETGKNAPFKDINILLVHEHDTDRDAGIENGNFYIKFKHGFPRGEVIAVAVYGTRTDTGNVVGEVYDVDRLMSKAEAHSAAYRGYLVDKQDFARMRSEGKLKTDSTGREYMIKKINKRDGGVWDKKIYEYELINPYDGADRPEMLRKSAGKTFFRPYMKTRNAAAMADEWQEEAPENREKAADDVLSKAGEQFTDVQGSQVKQDKEPIDAELVNDENNQDNKQEKGKKAKDENPETESTVDDLEIEIDDGDGINDL
jgi:hypothetical protein